MPEIRKYRNVEYQGTVSYADSAALVTALRGNATYKGTLWNEFENGSGVLGIPPGYQVILFVQDATVATTFHQIMLEPSFAAT